MKIVLGPVEEKYQSPPYHRKRVGLSHLAFYAPTKEYVDDYIESVLNPNAIKCLYENESKGDGNYCSVFFEGPDQIKIEVVLSPGYCSSDH